MWWVKHKNQTIRSLSPQQIVDCDTSGGDEGCNGGDTRTAYEYVMKQGGLEYWADCTLVAVQWRYCLYCVD